MDNELEYKMLIFMRVPLILRIFHSQDIIAQKIEKMNKEIKKLKSKVLTKWAHLAAQLYGDPLLRAKKDLKLDQ